VILLGPKHRHAGARAALAAAERWRMPFGDVPIDRALGERLLAAGVVVLDDAAHRDEHSLEVQVPFLWRRNPELLLTPIALGLHDTRELAALGRAIAEVIAALDEPVLLAASTDMSHHIPLAEAERLDRMALEPLLARDPERLYATVMTNGITMCGVIPTTAVLFAAGALGATAADLVQYTTSAAASGDTSRVVGYAGVIIS
jgi:AmmeMemoRadiSam system protein B